MLERKHKKLKKLLLDKKRILIAFSGGVDSSLLAKVAKDILGDDALAVTIDSEVIPRRELKEAKAMVRTIGIKQMVVKHSLLRNKEFTKNSKNRCYHCKKDIMQILKDIARKEGIRIIVDGTNADDRRSDRAGLRALREYRVISPLAECGIGKGEVRKLAEKLWLANCKKPAMTCLATRIPTGERITQERLKRIEKAEEFLHGLGIHDLRVRDHEDIARIEVKKEKFKSILDNKERIIKKFQRLGFIHTCLDIKPREDG